MSNAGEQGTWGDVGVCTIFGLGGLWGKGAGVRLVWGISGPFSMSYWWPGDRQSLLV